jgi:hypothetical protein
MPISRYIETSNLARPGVCTSSTRPASPYEGMVIYETDTNRTLVWDASAWVLVSTGTSNPVGSELVGSGTFSNAATFDVTGFSSSYDFYQLLISVKTTSVSNGLLSAQLVSGTTVRNSTYYGSVGFTSYLATTGIYVQANNVTKMDLTTLTTSPVAILRIDIHGIDSAEFSCVYQAIDTQNSYSVYGGFSNYAATNSFDKIRFTGGQNLTGYWNLMGVRKS